jgi:hypothetical protein
VSEAADAVVTSLGESGRATVRIENLDGFGLSVLERERVLPCAGTPSVLTAEPEDAFVEEGHRS